MLARWVPSGRLVAAATCFLVLYAAATVWLTWPLATVLGSHFPDVQAACRFDAPLVAWSLGHQAQALLGISASFANPPIFHPERLALYYGEAGTGALALFLPVYALSANPVLASNLTLLAGVVLTALGLHLVTWRWTSSHAAGVVAAWVFLTSRWLLWEWPPCAPNYAVLVFFPWIVVLAARPEGAREHPVLLTLLVAAQAAVTAYVATALFAPLLLLAALRCARSSGRRDGLRLLAVLAAAAVLVAPTFVGFALVRMENPNLARQSLWQGGIAPLPLPHGILGYLSPLGVPLATIALVAIGTVVVGLRWRRLARVQRQAWLVAALFTSVGLFLSLTPEVYWLGEPVRLPHAGLPIYRALRVTIRLGVTGLIGFCLLAGLAFAACTGPPVPARRGARLLVAPVLAAALAGLVLAERLSGYNPFGVRTTGKAFRSFPTRAVDREPELVDLLRSGEGPLLELPASVHGYPTPAWNADAMLRALEHGRPILNGYHGYWPREAPARLLRAEALPSREALVDLERETGLRTLVVHLDALRAEQRAPWQEIARRGGGDGLRLAARTQHVLVFDVEP